MLLYLAAHVLLHLLHTYKCMNLTHIGIEVAGVALIAKGPWQSTEALCRLPRNSPVAWRINIHTYTYAYIHTYMTKNVYVYIYIHTYNTYVLLHLHTST